MANLTDAYKPLHTEREKARERKRERESDREGKQSYRHTHVSYALQFPPCRVVINLFLLNI